MKNLWVHLFLLLIISTIDISGASPVDLHTSQSADEQKPSDVVSRQKRFIPFLGILRVLGTIGTGISVSAVNRQQGAMNRNVQAELNNIKQTLAQFYGQFSQFAREINDLETTMESKFVELKAELDQTKDTCVALGTLIDNKSMWNKQVAIFGRDVQRLQYLLMLLNDRLDRDQNGRIIINARAEEWAQAVLSKRDDGADQILMNLDHMVMGKSPIFMSQSIVKLYFQGLVETDAERWNKMDRLKETLHSLQAAGYVFWATALSIMNRTEDVNATVLPLAQERLDKHDQAIFKLYQPRLWQWPAGTYGLMKVKYQECPEGIGDWKKGSRQHDCDRGCNCLDDCFSNSLSIHMSFSIVTGAITNWEFCTKTSDDHDLDFEWPEGTYCILSKNGMANGFKRGWIFWDDDDSNEGGGKGTVGVLPDGEYNDNSSGEDSTKIYFNCRYDRSPDIPIQLPVQKPFMLFPLHGYIEQFPCQQVEGMNVTEEWYQWRSKQNNEGNKFEWPHPKRTGPRDQITLHFCYYVPI